MNSEANNKPFDGLPAFSYSKTGATEDDFGERFLSIDISKIRSKEVAPKLEVTENDNAKIDITGTDKVDFLGDLLRKIALYNKTKADEIGLDTNEGDTNPESHSSYMLKKLNEAKNTEFIIPEYMLAELFTRKELQSIIESLGSQEKILVQEAIYILEDREARKV